MRQPSLVQWAQFGSEDPHTVLGLPDRPRPAPADAVKKAHTRLAKKWHPDRGGNNAAMQLINAAADKLRPAPGKRPPPDSPPGSPSTPASDTSAPVPPPPPTPPPPATSQAQLCGVRHAMVKKQRHNGVLKYEMFSAASDGCLDCVRYYVEVAMVDAASKSDSLGYNGVAWADWARGGNPGAGHEAVAAYLSERAR